MQKRNLNKFFLHHGKLYFRVTVDGKRQAVTTRTDDMADAVKYQSDYIRKLKARTRSKKKRIPTLADILLPFTNPDDNPKRREGEITGRLYGSRHARKVASYTRRFGERWYVTPSQAPRRSCAQSDPEGLQGCHVPPHTGGGKDGRGMPDVQGAQGSALLRVRRGDHTGESRLRASRCEGGAQGAGEDASRPA